MAPKKFYPQYSYSGYQATNPAKPLPGPQVDNDLLNISRSINEIIDAGVGGGGPGPGPGGDTTTDHVENRSNLSGSMLTAALNGVSSRLVSLEAGGGGGGGATFYYPSREAAAAASPGSAALLMVLHGERVLFYEKVDAGNAYPALVTADGQKWGPADRQMTPLHWGAVGNYSTDDHGPIQAMFNFLATGTSMPDSYAAGRTWTISGAGKKYAVSKPICIGNIGTGAGMLYYGHVEDLHLKAIQGAYNWSSYLGIGGEVSSNVLTVAYQFNNDAGDSFTGIYKVAFERITIDCNFLTGGIYLQNTTQLSFRDIGIDFIGKNRCGFETSIGLPIYNPRGYRTVNGAMLIENVNIQGYVEEAPKFSGEQVYPTGEDQISMNTIAFKIQTNDARYHQVICSRVTRAMQIEYCGAIQFSDIHPWSREIYIGPTTNNLMWSNCYFDYTKVIVDGGAINNWNHYFEACHWILGSADRGLELRTEVADTTGKGLIINGCRFKGDGNDINIECTASGTGFWRGVLDREYQLTGCQFGQNSDPDAFFKAGKHITVDAELGYTYFRQTADGDGRMQVASSFITAGKGRFSGGAAGVYLQWQSGAEPGTDSAVYVTATGNLILENKHTGTGEIVFGVQGNWGVSRVKADGSMQVYGQTNVNAAAAGLKVGRGSLSRSINAGGTINASGADYAEYHEVIEPLWGNVPKGAILGYNADGLLTDRFDDVVGRFVVKSTDPNLVGADRWGTEEALVAKYGVEPVGEQPELRIVEAPKMTPPENMVRPPVEIENPSDEAAAQAKLRKFYEDKAVAQAVYDGYRAETAAAQAEYDAALAAYEARRTALLEAVETERVRYDRIAKAGFVPVNVTAAPADIGKYLVPARAEDGSATAVLKTIDDLVGTDYIRAIGVIIGVEPDGRASVEVKSI